MSTPDPVYFLVHIPKCAGSTVEDHFQRHLGEQFLIAPRWKNALRDIVGNRVTLPDADRRAVRAVSGHSLALHMANQFAPRPVRNTVILREPVSFHVSFYNYRHDRATTDGVPKPPQFEQWYAMQKRNQIARFLLRRTLDIGLFKLYTLSSRAQFRLLNDTMREFYFVGDISQTNSLIAEISNQLGVNGTVTSSNVTKSRQLSIDDLKPEMKAQIVQDNAIDHALYRLWKDRGFGQGLPPEASEMASELPGNDRFTYIANDLISTLRKKAHRL